MSHRLSGSKRSLAAWCLYWARGDVELPAQQSSDPARLGSATHEASEAPIEAGAGEDDDWDLDEPLAEAAAASADGVDRIAEKWGLSEAQREALEAMLAAWRAWWPAYSAGRQWRREVPFAYDVARDTARELASGDKVDHRYAVRPEEYPNTLDALSLPDVDGRAVVLDIKTGRSAHTLAEHLPQLELGALCVARVYGAEEVLVVVAHVTAHGVYPDEATLDAFDLDVAAAQMRREVESVAASEPTAGAHCRALYCPAIAVCPVTHSLVREVPETRHLPIATITSAADLRILLDGLPMLEAWAKHMRGQARAFVDSEGGAVALPDGSTYARREVAEESFTLSPRAESALRGELGEEADTVIKRTIAKGRIDDVARRLSKKRGDIKRVRERVLEALRGAGAAKVFTYPRYERRAAKAAATGGDDV